MKKYIYVFAAFAAIVSCSKENTVNEENNLDANSKKDVHELFVTISDLTDADTKATIAEADGTFTWTAGDAIAVKTTTNDVYEFTAETGGSASARFTYTGEMNGTPAYVKYPYTADFSDTALPTSISGLTTALTAANIRMEGTITDNAVTLTHQNALLKVSFTNVPTFASKVSFVSTATGYEQNITVSGISLGSKGNVVAYIPVKPGSYSFSVNLIDSADNTMISKTTASAKTFTAGTLKKMTAIPLGTLVMMSNAGGSYGGFSKMKVYNWWDGGSHNLTSPLSQITISATVYGYYFLPADLSEGKEVNIKVENGDDSSKNTQTVVYNLRDFTFTIKSGDGGIATTYRYYFNNTGSWSQINAYIWDEYDTAKNGSWPGGKLTLTASNGWYYYQFVEGDYGYTRHVKFSDNGGTTGGDHNNKNVYRDWYFTD